MELTTGLCFAVVARSVRRQFSQRAGTCDTSQARTKAEPQENLIVKAKLSTASRILRNFASLAFADFFNKALAFVGVAYLARVLEVDGFGKIEFAQAIIVYFMLIARQGLNTFGAREVARSKSNIKTCADHVLSMKLFLSVASYALLIIFALLMCRSAEMHTLLLLYGLTIFTFSLALDWVFQGTEKMEYVALGRIINQALYVGGIVLLVRDSGQLLGVPILRVAAALVGAVVLLYVFVKGYGRIRLRFDPQLWKEILKQSIPMGVSFILIRVYYTFDTVMLGFMKGETVVGWYNAAYKVVLLFTGFASLFGTAIFPVLSRTYKESPAQLRGLMLQLARVTLFFGLPIAVGGTMLGHQIVPFIYGSSYRPAILPLQLLIWSVFTVYFNCSFAFCLLACDRQKDYMYSVLAGAATNLILNFTLIPRYGMLGASIATLACEVVVLGLILFFAGRVAKAVPGADLLKVVCGSGIMGVSLYLLKGSLAIEILAGILVYLSVVIILRGIKPGDVQWLRQIIKGSTSSGREL